MICITGNESTLEGLEARFAAAEKAFGPATMHEVRLDFLAAVDEATFSLLRRRGDRVIACCRPTEGTSETERRDLLIRAAASGAAWIDIEEDAIELLHALRTAGSRVIASFHDFDGLPVDLSSILRTIDAHRPDLLKVAVTVRDAAELIAVRDATSSLLTSHIAIGMGDAGRLSRLRHRSFGSPWTYVAADDRAATADGQLTFDEAKLMGLPGSADAPFIALLGGRNVAHSPGPRIYNTLFRHAGMPWSYLAVPTVQPGETLGLLRDLGALGAAVTIPHKEVVLAHAQPDSLASRVRAANSIRFETNGAVATNTDVEGVRVPLAAALQTRPATRALILGRGGASRAAAAACKELGVDPVVIGRDRWEERSRIEAGILINATPITDSAIWPGGTPLRKAIVFDLAFGASRSELLRRAESEGAVAIPPLAMWVIQGARQMSWITGQPFEAYDLLEIAG